jgi:hypothetical protein
MVILSIRFAREIRLLVVAKYEAVYLIFQIQDTQDAFGMLGVVYY